MRNDNSGQDRPDDDERGTSTLEFVLILPALLFLIFGTIQFTLWYFAGEVARSAATSGAQAGSISNGGQVDATQTANNILRGPGQNVIHGGQVAYTAHNGTVTVTVKGHATSLLVGFNLNVHATANEPVEQFTPEHP